MTMSLKGMLCAGSVAVSMVAASPVHAHASTEQQQSQPQNQQQQDKQQTPMSQQTRTTPETVELGDVEENPGRFMNRAITVQGEIDEVLGPRVFKIDEQNWGDLDGEILVVLAAPMAALIDEDDRVTVTGTLRPFVRADVEREWGLLGLDPEVEVDLKSKPVLMASALVSTDDNMALAIGTVPAGAGSSGQTTSGTQGSGTSAATGTTGSMAGKSRADSQSPVTDVSALAKSTDRQMVGRRANLRSVKVEATDKNGGFWVSVASGDRLYVLPADNNKVTAKAGQAVTIEGYVLRMPRQMEQKLEKDPKTGNEEIYVYATTVK